MCTRAISLLGSLFLTAIFNLPAFAIEAETAGQETMGNPTPKWFIAMLLSGPGYIFDGESGEMQGMLSLGFFTPAVQPNTQSGEIYAAESFYTRGNRGQRTDVMTAYDLKTLSPSYEIKLPTKLAAVLPYRQYIALMDDDRYLAIFNMTPAQSVSIVDVKSHEFVREISTPGCGLIMPVPNRGFLMICGDGTLQLLRLGNDGNEENRVRSNTFFKIDGDPVFDIPVPTADGWLLLSFEGLVFEATTSDESILISEPWSVLNEEDSAEHWRVGGGQLYDVHVDMNLLFIIMHQGGTDTHRQAGTEIWVFNRETRQRIARIEAGEPVANLLVSQDKNPILVVGSEAGPIHILDVKTTKRIRTIANPGSDPWLLQRF